jgi:hypothetical protein
MLETARTIDKGGSPPVIQDISEIVAKATF